MRYIAKIIIQNQRCHALLTLALLAQMTDPKPDSAEARLGKASWIMIVVGGATTFVGYQKSGDAEKRNEKFSEMNNDINSGRLKMEPGFEHQVKHSRPIDTDYSLTIAIGVLMVFAGIGLSRYSDKLRKKRTGE